jgi:hypothetical protein
MGRSGGPLTGVARCLAWPAAWRGPLPGLSPAAVQESDNVDSGRRERSGPHANCGSQMQSKDAGLKGLASPVEAAGGESTG